MEVKISFSLNGKKTTILTDPNQTLLWVLRNQLGLTGTKYGCGNGFCGACTVLINKEAIRSCITPITDVAGKEVITIEGLARNGKLSPVQKAFVEHDALQCGFCTPGMVLAGEALLAENSRPSRLEIRTAIAGNLCRCTGYQQIVDAIQITAQKRLEKKTDA